MTSRTTTKVTLPSASIGTQVHLLFHRYGPQNSGLKAYIQASLHADELPGLMVSHHLIHLLEEADKKNLIAKEIIIVPFANPIGLGQNFLGSHEGRFNIATGINFNRNFAEVTAAVLERVDGKLQPDEKENVRIVREAFRAELDSRCSPDKDPMAVEDAMKLHLLREACDADIVLDLHCDNGTYYCPLFQSDLFCMARVPL
jgi:predicted deacylase